jgi:hypothetical protein
LKFLLDSKKIPGDPANAEVDQGISQFLAMLLALVPAGDPPSPPKLEIIQGGLAEPEKPA